MIQMTYDRLVLDTQWMNRIFKDTKLKKGKMNIS